MRVAVIGSRECGDLSVEEILARLPEGCTEIVSGGAIGVDRLAREAARRSGIPLREFLPDYQTFGRQAPLIRDQEIAAYADEILAFWDFRSRGTRYTILQALSKDKPVTIVNIDDPAGDAHTFPEEGGSHPDLS